MDSSNPPLNIGVIGCGHWGPNHVRVFSELDRSSVSVCADTCLRRLERLKRRFPGIQTTSDYRRILDDDRVEAVVVATPTATHADIAEAALLAGKHLLVEKPLALTTAAAQHLTDIANRRQRVLMVGHVFLFNNGIRTLRSAIDAGQLGKLHYIDAVRTNLGPVRGDVNALYDLGTHDISIFNYLMGESPVSVSAQGVCITQAEHEDVVFATLRYQDGMLGHLHVSWLNPRKVRTLTVVGERKMAHWDDVDPEDTLRIYDKGMEDPPYYDSFGQFQFLLRNSDVYLPKIDRAEPLVNQATAFLDSVLDAKPCRSGGPEAIGVIATLEAAQESLRSGGAFCPLSTKWEVMEKSAKCVDVPLADPKPHWIPASNAGVDE